MKKMIMSFGIMFFLLVSLPSCGNKNDKNNEVNDSSNVEEDSGNCEGAQEFANTLDTRIPNCFKADNCEKREDGTFVVHLTSHCGEDMVNDGRGSFGEREVRVGFDGKEYYVK
jgi:hypothetical protein